MALPRRDDLDLLPAWIGVDDDRRRRGPAVATVIRQRRLATLVESAGELGLAVGALGERRGDDVAVIPTELGRGPAPVSTLRGLRVVDLSSLWAGPLCGQLLAEAGVDVVKVESTRRLDGARHGPAAFFDLVNAGKSSVLLDLGERSGIEALRALVATADVVIESTRPAPSPSSASTPWRRPPAADRGCGCRSPPTAGAHRTTCAPASATTPRSPVASWRETAAGPCSAPTPSPTRPPGCSPPSPSSTASSPAVGGCSTSPWPASAR